MIKTTVLDILGIEYPVLQGGMQWIATAELAAAVSNAGGLGIISAFTFPDRTALRQELRKARGLTNKPIAINMSIFPALRPPDYWGYLEAAAEEGVKIIETSGRLPDEFAQFFKDNGFCVMHKCTTVRHALSAQKMGCNMVIMDGMECAGHPGESDIGSMVLTARAVQALSIPVVSSGGFADGRGLAAALMLGAQGVLMGTRFMITKESPILQSVKEHIANNVAETDTTLIMRPYRNTTRVYANQAAAEVKRIESSGAPFESIAQLVSGRRGWNLILGTGNVQTDGTLALGMSAGLIHDIPSCAELMERIMCEAQACIGKYS